MVEAPGDLPGHLHVGHLVHPHRHALGFVHQDVGGLEHRIAQKAVGGQVFVGQLLHLVFIGGVALQPGHRGEHAEDEVEFAVLRDGGLHEEGGFLRVEPHAQPIDEHLRDVAADVLRGFRIPW